MFAIIKSWKQMKINCVTDLLRDWVAGTESCEQFFGGVLHWIEIQYTFSTIDLNIFGTSMMQVL